MRMKYCIWPVWMVLACSSLVKAQVLAVGDSFYCTVSADQRINKTGLLLETGAVYHITASGMWQDAGFEPTDANGFKGFTKNMKRGNFLKPKPGENYMKLIAKVKGIKTPIGVEAKLTCHKKGELLFMPNDARFFFKNNSGSLKVCVVREKG